jgi:SAM-dependent methyltransferase
MYHKKIECICCNNTELISVLDLNEQPLANSYHTNESELLTFPLRLNLCTYCYHLQLSHIVNPDLLFKDYLYVSGTTSTLKDYFTWFADFAIEQVNKTKGSVLDIACNDGSQLNPFKKLNWDTYGVDPAENLLKLSNVNHNVICDYFNDSSFKGTKFDIIIAQNVFAHNENAKQFLDDCEKLMDDESLLFVQTSQAEMINQNQFDTIYHEHLSFFNINSFNELSKRTKLNLVNVIKSPVHGISYIFVLSKKQFNKALVKNLIDVERENGLLSKSTYETYKNNVLKIVQEFTNTINTYKASGYKIVGYGAAAKGMTFLNFANVKLDYIIDDNELKQNLYTPGTNIQIKPASFINTYEDTDKILFVPLAWNFFKEIKTRIQSVRTNQNDLYLKYFPSISIEI